MKTCAHIYHVRTLVALKWAIIIQIAPDSSRSDNRDMINKVIKLKLQYFKHDCIQATCQRDPEVYATYHDPKIYPHTKFGIPTLNYIQICIGLDFARTETRGHSDLEPVGNSPGPKMYLRTKYGTATRRSAVDAFFQYLTPEIKVTVAENSERHSITPAYI